VNYFHLHVPPVVASCCVISGAYMSQGVGRWRNSHKTARHSRLRVRIFPVQTGSFLCSKHSRATSITLAS